ncbi:hypothetical protein Bca4012_006515 [Brassica carinata]|uniref:Uncharacterized protein n=1 Tax=Brassica cretica TaxID=69181 RepID=A0ABQ7CJH2_BRACR|nr:hypothetical protein DY000_02009320 [Brassica cretica]
MLLRALSSKAPSTEACCRLLKTHTDPVLSSHLISSPATVRSQHIQFGFSKVV